MVDAGGVFAQLIRVTVALVLAFVAAGFFLAFGLFQVLSGDAHPAEIGAAVGTGLVGASVIGGLAFVPALVAVLLSEALALRGIVFHLAAGGAIAFGLWVLQETGAAEAAASGLPRGSLVVLAAGFSGGFVYWLLAGRQAGCWRIERPSSRDSDAPSE